MSDARWLDVNADIAAATRHFSNARALHATGGFEGTGLERYRAEMALMHALQAAHTSAEAALLRVLRLLAEEPPIGEDWHSRLIDRLSSPVEGEHARPALLPPEIAADLHETRSFRHRVMHSYGDFNIARAKPAIEAAGRLALSLPDAVARFRTVVDPD